MKYYILSLKWTNPKDLLFTFYRSNAAGYTWFKHNAGIYDEREAKIHQSSTAIPVDKDLVDDLFSSVFYEGHVCKGLPVNEITLEMLGLTEAVLYAKRPNDFRGMEFVLDEHPEPNALKTRHNLDFMAVESDRAPEWIAYKVGTVEGLYNTTADAYQILVFTNSKPG